MNDRENPETLKKRIGEEAYKITQEKGTERPFTGEYNDLKDEGMFRCVVCGEELFNYDTKFDSGSGWPSFYDAYKKDAVEFVKDDSMGIGRTEVKCKKCGSHLGHVFEDGSGNPTNKRYCINSCALDFKKEKSSE